MNNKKTKNEESVGELAMAGSSPTVTEQHRLVLTRP
jgi:hypothetical protein